MGCKGVGRVIWLKAFSKVLIESTYLGDDEKYYERNFDFSIFEKTKLTANQLSGKTKPGTKVILRAIFKSIKANAQNESIPLLEKSIFA